jgi:hypothetical protein
MLALRPVSVDDISSLIQEGFGKGLEIFEEAKVIAREKATLVGDAVVPKVPNAFFNPEGIEFWDSILKPVEVEEVSTKGGKNAKEKPKAGKPGALSIEEQRKLYYKSLYDSISNSLLDNISESMLGMETKLNASKISVCRYFQTHNISVVRPEDIQQQQNAFQPIFLSSNGDCFSNENIDSAFDVKSYNQNKVLETIINCSEWGARCIVFLYESANSSIDNVMDIQSAMKSRLDNIVAGNLSLRKSKQINLPAEFNVVGCVSLPMLRKHLEIHNGNISNWDNSKATIYILNNLLFDNIVPPVVEFQEVLSDDDECPIPIGLSEDIEYKKNKFYNSDDKQTVICDVVISDKKYQQKCHTNPSKELYNILSIYNTLWIDSNISSLFAKSNTPLNILKSMNVSISSVVSNSVREMVLWGSVLTHFPYANMILSNSSPSHIDKKLEPYFQSLFPPNMNKDITFLASIGGEIRLEKFVLINELIDMVSHNIYISNIYHTITLYIAFCN